jgi:hypothetical protein
MLSRPGQLWDPSSLLSSRNWISFSHPACSLRTCGAIPPLTHMSARCDTQTKTLPFCYPLHVTIFSWEVTYSAQKCKCFKLHSSDYRHILLSSSKITAKPAFPKSNHETDGAALLLSNIHVKSERSFPLTKVYIEALKIYSTI